MAKLEDLDFEFKEIADERVIGTLDKIGRALAVIYNSIKGFKVNLPKVFKVEGSVDVDSIADMPPVEVKNLKDMAPYFNSLEERIRNLAVAISTAKGTKINFPKMEFPKFDNSPVIEELRALQEELKAAGGKQIKFPKSISVDNFPVQLTPQPVTHISINALQGYVHTTSATVTSTLTTLPSYGVLDNRRSLLIYNNSANTIFIGGSDVTTGNGLPIAANSFSPILDLGKNTIAYGIATSGNNDVRVMEISDESSGR